MCPTRVASSHAHHTVQALLCRSVLFVDPEWVSLSLGVFICMNCSGVHRELGSAFSQVKSLLLDHWTPEMIKTLVRAPHSTGRLVFSEGLY